VFGNGNPFDAIAGVFGQSNHGRTGVIGVVQSTTVSPTKGVGVAGLSMGDIGSELNYLNLPLATGDGTGVFGASGSSFGVQGTSSTGVGVRGFSLQGNGVSGESSSNDGVSGISDANGKSGVFGFNTKDTSEQAFGVSGTCNSTNPTSAGVFGFADSANGVGGNSNNGNGVSGHSALNDGVSGISDANGKSGVFGFNTNPSGAAFGVSGTVNSPDGAGVNGFSDLGYGGHLRGGRAPLHLEPANTPGRPTTGDHQRGELFVDSNGDLFYCKDSGTPGNWFRVQLTPA
jgi:hypothetical protein